MTGLFVTAVQARLFLLCVGLGAGAGVLYDLLTLSYKGFGHKGQVIGEMLFVLTVACALFALLRKCDADFRSYAVLGVSVGWFLYAATVSFFLHGGVRKMLVKKRTKWRADG